MLDLSRIEAACLPENVASRALLERSGFEYEGVAQGYLQIERPLARPRALRQPARDRPGRRRRDGGEPECRRDLNAGRRAALRSSGWRRRSGPGGVRAAGAALSRGAARALPRRRRRRCCGPASTAAVAAAVAVCAEARVGIVPYSGGTGLVGGQVVGRRGRCR